MPKRNVSTKLTIVNLAKAAVASLWPQNLRRWWYPEPPYLLIRGAAISGALEFLLFGYAEFTQFRAHFLAQAAHFSQGNEGTQLAALAVIVVAEIFYPVSLLLIVLTVEGAIRFFAGVLFDEAVPSLPFWLSIRLWDRFVRKSQANTV